MTSGPASQLAEAAKIWVICDAGRVQAAADGQPVNEFEEVIERGLDRLPHIGLWVDPSGIDPQGVVDLLLDRRAEAAWMVVDRFCKLLTCGFAVRRS